MCMFVNRLVLFGMMSGLFRGPFEKNNLIVSFILKDMLMENVFGRPEMKDWSVMDLYVLCESTFRYFLLYVCVCLVSSDTICLIIV